MRSLFKPFLEQLGFAMQPVQMNGGHCYASFVDRRHTVHISLEHGDAQATVMVITNGVNDLRSIDDPAKTPRLSHLNVRYMEHVSAIERDRNEEFFGRHALRDDAERRLLKCAKDLRLVLPRYLAS